MSVADRLLLQPANRATLGADITRAILAVERTGSMESKPGVVVTVNDPRSALIESKLLTRPSQRDIGSPAANTLRPIDLLLDGVWYRLQQASRTGQTVAMTFDHRGAVFMAEHDTAMSASRGQATRAQFIRRQVFEAGRRRNAGYKLAFWAPEVGRAMPQAKMTEQTSSRAEPDRDPGSIIERANRLKGVKVRGRELDAGQRRNAAVMIVQCEKDGAGPKPTLACTMACIVEAPDFANPTGGDSSSVGILQLLNIHLNGSTSTSGGRRDVALVVHLFLTRGFWGKGGAIEIARKNPGMSAGLVAQNAQGSAFPARYDQVAADARRVIAALGGTTGASTTDTGGSYVKPFRFRREKGVNAWQNTSDLATEVGRRRFITIPARGSDVFVYAADEDLFKLRPQARLSLDAPYIVGEPSYDLDFAKTIRSVQLQVLGDPFDADFAWGLPAILEDDPLVDGTWLVWDVRETDGSATVDLELRQPQPFKPEPASETLQRTDNAGTITLVQGEGLTAASRGAKTLVDAVAALAHRAGGDSIYVGSAERPGAFTTSGNVSDHSENNERRAARDIGKRGVNLITGPPPAELDRAVVAIGEAFGRPYRAGQRIVDAFTWRGLRVQIIWRTPEFGGHMGHIHCGARR